MSGESYVFSVEYAVKYGVDHAIMIHHLQHWIRFNQRAGRPKQEGHSWMYQTQKDMVAHFPFWNRDYIQKILSELEEKGIIIKGNFNKNKFDRTSWYAFKNEEMFTIVPNSTMDDAKQHKGECQTASCIYTDTETDAKTKSVCVATPPVASSPPRNILSEHVKCTKKSADGTDLILSKNDLISRAIIAEKDWDLLEIDEAWQIFIDYSKPIANWFNFFEGVILNNRTLKGLKKQQEHFNKRAKRCKIQDMTGSKEKESKIEPSNSEKETSKETGSKTRLSLDSISLNPNWRKSKSI
jgi:hypothetical protein